MIIVEIYFSVLQTIFRLKKTIHYNTTDALDAMMSLSIRNKNSSLNKQKDNSKLLKNIKNTEVIFLKQREIINEKDLRKTSELCKKLNRAKQ